MVKVRNRGEFLGGKPNLNAQDLEEDVFEALGHTDYDPDDLGPWEGFADANPVMLHEVFDEGIRPRHEPSDASSWDQTPY